MTRKLQLNGQPAVWLADDRAVTAYLAPLQPPYKDRQARRQRIHLGRWFKNQGERSRLLIQNGYVFGRIDCLTPA
jgi:hypothetical protein